MKKTKKTKYQFNITFKIGSILILVLSGVAVAFGIGLFIFGLTFIFRGVYDETANKTTLTNWGIVMIVMGFYTAIINLFAIYLTANSVNQRNANNMKLNAIMAIIGIIAMAGGITLIFTPVAETQKMNLENIKDNDSVVTVIKEHNDEFIIINEELKNEQKEKLKKELKILKSKIDNNTANEYEKEEFIDKLKEYNKTYKNKK